MASQKDYDNLNQANAKLASLLAVKPTKGRDGKSFYLVDGVEYTKFGYDKLVKNQKFEVQKFRDVIVPPAVAEERKSALAGEARKQAEELTVSLQKLTRTRKDFEMASSRAGTSQERERLDRWVRVYQDKETEFQNAISQLASDLPLASLPEMPQLVTPDKAKQMPIQEPQVPTAPTPGPTTATTTTGMFGQEVTVPGPGVAAPQTRPTTPSRMPSLEQINAARAKQNLPALELVDGKYREVVSKKEVSASEVAASTGATTTGTTTVAGGGTGGAAVGGTTTGAVPPTPAAPGAPVVPASWEEAAREQFGAYYEVVKNIPEVMKIIERDMTVGLSDAQFQAELEKTTWWRTTTASARAWEEDKARDPATVQTRIDNQLATLRNQSLTLGLRLRDDVLAKLAEDSLRFGWSATVINNTLGAEALRSSGGVSDLRRGYIGQTIRATAGSYGVPLSDVTFNEWVGKIATGQENEASFQAFALDIAKNLYPSLAPALDKGVSFRAITDPYRQSAARILEINPESVDFADPKWAQAFTFRDEKGNQTMMTYGEWNDYLRTTPSFGYEYTDGAKERAFTVVNRLGELFGAA